MQIGAGPRIGGGAFRVWVTAVAAVVLAAAATPRAHALRLPEERPGRRVLVNLMWSPNYLCFAARVPDPMVTGSSTAPMSAPEEDDAIEFCLEIPGPAGPRAHRLAISAAGGMTLLTRDATGPWRSDPSWVSTPPTVKYAVQVNGTLNDARDEDSGFVVECAIPWELLGGEPRIGEQLRFNVVCWMQGENEGLASWSPAVTTPADVGDTARWGRLLIAPGSASEPAQGMQAVAPLVMQDPFVDGKLDAGEWLTSTTLQFDRPEPALTPVTTPAAAPLVAAPTLLALYRYDWQGGPAQTGGAAFWQRASPSLPATADQPKEGAGPWYSYERVDWHMAQLAEVQRAGIDIILVEYRGDDESRRTWARTGLERLAEALKWLRAEGRDYPLVGLMLDTEPLRGVDLRTDAGKRLLYGMIREVFLRVPREFWAEIGARPEEGITGGVPILLGEPGNLAGWDASFVNFCDERFGRDFPGARLAWLGSSAWRSGGVDGFYAYVRLPDRTGFTQESVGGAPAVALSPGYCPAPGTGGEVRPRREGRAYRADWQRVVAAKPELVVIDSWNDFATATEVAPSREHGFEYVDITRYFQSRMGSSQPRQLALRSSQVPKVLAPGRQYEVELVVQNLGTEDIRTGVRTSADYRIIRRADGAEMQHRVAAQSVEVLAGQTRRLPVIIATVDDAGKPLPPGDYIYSVEIVRSRLTYVRSSWFARALAQLKVPITVGEPPQRAATILTTSLPSSMESGATEAAVVRVRNDGSAVWKAGEMALSYHWLRQEDNLTASSEEVAQVIVRDGARVALASDVPPGAVVSVTIPVTAVAADGSPLPPSDPGAGWHYRVAWDLVAGKDNWVSGERGWLRSETVEVVGHDWGVRFESANAPAQMEAGSVERVTLVLANDGPRTWEPSEAFYVAAHWHRWDGVEVGPECLSGPTAGRLPTAVRPGERVVVTADLHAPTVAGTYWLRWEMVCDGQGWDEQRGGQRGDLLVSPVLVTGGKYRPIDLAALINVPAITTDTYRARGDFDGRGRSLPAEWIPPDLSGALGDLYPSGYYAQVTEVPVPFAFPRADDGIGGAVACTGQTIEIGGNGAKTIWLLAAAATGEARAGLRVVLADGRAETADVLVPSWTERSPSYALGAYAPCVRLLSGDDASVSAYLHVIPLHMAGSPAVALELPNAPQVRIVAITVEEP